MDIRDKVFLRLQAIEDQHSAAMREAQLARMRKDYAAEEEFLGQRAVLSDLWNRLVRDVVVEPGSIRVPILTKEDVEHDQNGAYEALDFTRRMGLPIIHELKTGEASTVVKHKLDELAFKIKLIEHFASMHDMQSGEQGPVDDDPFDLGLGDIDFGQ